MTPGQFIVEYWSLYLDTTGRNRSLNGAIFENLVIIALAREGIEPIYYQTSLTYVPTAIFDVLLYELQDDGTERPIALSLKTSIRERWKQADLEAAALKQVHKEAECYLLSLDEGEISRRQRQAEAYAGLDEFILASSTDFDNLVYDLKTRNFVEAGHVPIIKSSDRVYDDDDLWDHFHFQL